MDDGSRVLFVGGPLHGRLHEVPHDWLSYLIPAPQDLDRFLSTLSDQSLPTPEPIRYERVAWSYPVAEDYADGAVDHRCVMLGPITEDQPTYPPQDGVHPVYPHMADRMWRARAEELIPPCVVPDCGEKGRVVVFAAEMGRLAGRFWNRGDKIRLCPAHLADVHRAQGQPIENLAEWLRPDACNLDPLDQFDVGHAGPLFQEDLLRKLGRTLRIAVTARA